MNVRPPRSRCWSALRLSAMLGVVVTSGAAGTALAAHRESASPVTLRGLITTLGTDTLQVQTSNGTVTVGLNRAITHVMRSVVGSTADITSGKRVDLHVVRGTRTIDVVRIEQYRPASVPVRGTLKVGDRSSEGREPLVNTSALQALQVVSLNGTTLTVRNANGATVTFTLGPNVRVNETLNGSLADLGVGEMVQIVIGKPNTVAHSITILTA